MLLRDQLCTIAVALFCAVALGSGLPAGAANILTNPGFENGVTIYSGDSTGGGNGWSYVMLAGNNAIRPETYYAGNQFPPTPNTGTDAIRFRTSWGGECYIYQEAQVLPNSQYTASVWVRAWSDGSGFGQAGDLAGILIQEFDGGGNWLGNVSETYIYAANEAYEQVNAPAFTTGPNTRVVRFVLHANILADYQHGAVSFDDCVLDGQSVIANVSGFVKSGGVGVAGVTVSSQDQTTTTGANGAYSLSGLVAGTAVITGSKDGYWTVTKQATMAPGSNTVDLDIVAKPANNLLLNGGFEDGVTIYSGTGSGGGYGWSYQILYDSCAIRPETYYATNTYPSSFHSGTEAIRFRTSTQGPPGGESIIWQDAQVRPSTSYTASAWVRAYSGASAEFYFGADPADKAGIWIQEFDGNGNFIQNLEEVDITQANVEYEYISKTFTTSSNTRRVRYILHSVISANYATGAIAYDDCALDGPSVLATLSGTITGLSAGSVTALEGATVTLQGKTATTDAEGEFSIEDLTAGAATLVIAKEGYWSETKDISLVPGTNPLNQLLIALPANNLLVNNGFELGVVAYSGTGGPGGGLYWTHQMLQGDNAARAESYYTGLDPADIFSREYHSGDEAIRFRGSGTSEGITFQDVYAVPNAQYTASVWVRGYDEGTGFGRTPGDMAGIQLKGLDAGGNEIADYGEAFISEGNTAYQYLQKAFTTGAGVAKIRFILHTMIGADYLNGAVAYDDCALDGPGAATTVQGTVTASGAALPGATVSVLGKSVLTGNNGEYTVSGELNNQQVVQVSKAGYWPSSATPVLAPGANTVPAVDLKPVAVNNLLANPGFELGVSNHNSPGTYSSFGWTYVLVDNGVPGGGSPAIRAESYYQGDQFAPTYHSGTQAIRMRCSGGGGSADIFQDFAVQPGDSFIASTWVLPRSNGSGFGTDPNDRAGIRIYAVDSGGNAIEPAIAENLISTVTSGYEYLGLVFSVPAGVTKVRYALHTSTASDYSNGAVTYDDCGLEAYSQATTVAALKSLADETPASLSGRVVTANFNGFFYIEEQDRSSGIKVIGTAAAGDVVSVRGRVTTLNGEKTLIADTVSKTGTGTIPGILRMRNWSAARDLAGGLYVTVWGRVMSVDAPNNAFKIADGSGVDLKVEGTPGDSQYVTVDCVLGAELVGGVRSAIAHPVAISKVF